jgi:hypothetical protein
VTVMAYSPTAQIFILMVMQILHGFVVLFTGLSRSAVLRVGKVMELAGFVGLEIILLVCYNQAETLTA